MKEALDKKEKVKETSNDMKYSSYVRRNVCKSVIRNINSYFRKNKITVCKVLIKAGYTDKEIKEEMLLLKLYNETQLRLDSKTFQKAIEEILEGKIILIYLLKEVLDRLLISWEKGSYGKIAIRNLKAYKDISISYYNRAIQILAKEQPILLTRIEN